MLDQFKVYKLPMEQIGYLFRFYVPDNFSSLFL
jgi:hypothetical protein